MDHELCIKLSTFFKDEFKNKFSKAQFLYSVVFFNDHGRPSLMATFLLFSFLIKQRIGIKSWFLEALWFLSLIKWTHIRKSSKLLLFVFSVWTSTKEKIVYTTGTTSRAVPTPGSWEIFATSVGALGNFVAVCGDGTPLGSCHHPSGGYLHLSVIIHVPLDLLQERGVLPR